MKALVLGPDAAVRQRLEQALRAHGHEVTACLDPQSAWEAFQRESPPIVVVDGSSPSPEWLDLCRRIRGTPQGDRTAVLATVHRPDGLRTALEAGADDCLVVETEAAAMEARLAVLERRAQELTQSRQVDEALLRLMAAVEAMQLGVTITDLGGKILYTNAAEASMHGYTVEELVGRDARMLSPREDWKTLGPDELRQIRRWRRERVRFRKDETAFPVQLISDVVMDPLGQPLGIVTTCEDITERKQAEEALRQSEQRYRGLVDSARDVIFTLSLDGTFASLNPAFERLTGWPCSEWLGKGFADLVHPDELAEARAVFKRVVGGESPPFTQRRVRTRAGEWLTFETTSTPLVREGRVVGTEGVARDITERKRVQEALRESEERFALAARGTNDGIWDWDLKSDRIYLSPRWKSILGYDEGEVGDTPRQWLDRVHPEDRERVEAKIASHREGQVPHFEDEHRLLHKDGTYRWVLSRGFAVRDPSGSAYRMAGALTDVTDRRAYDPLTALPNRALFVEHVAQAVARAKRRNDGLFAVLFLDLDGFKLVNDTLGHLAGDQLLIALARRLESCVRPGDVVSRFGGDEFAILLERIMDVSDAIQVAERIQKELSLPVELAGHEVPASGSIGIALGTASYEGPDEILRDADGAMYRAKALGKKRYVVFDDGMRSRVRARRELEDEVRAAVERLALRVHYQPIVCLTTGDLVGFEALVRWPHPERGLLPPSEFLPTAEETGLILPAGAWVLREACRQTRAWRERAPSRPLSISVNLSARQLRDPGLTRQVEDILVETDLEPRCLILEVSESAITGSAGLAGPIVARLRNLGVRLHLDDFGTGEASLRHLHGLLLHGLKIDQSVVARISAGASDLALLRSALALAEVLGLTVTAEGVETKEQCSLLRALGCRQGQGFLFGEAAEPAEVEGIVSAGRWTPATG